MSLVLFVAVVAVRKRPNKIDVKKQRCDFKSLVLSKTTSFSKPDYLVECSIMLTATILL